MKRMDAGRGQDGFTLLEVLVSVVILSFGLLAIASLQSSLIRAGGDAKAQTLAMGIAKKKIEQLSAIQSLGGSDNNCVSPTDWVIGTVSCYRAVADEDAQAFDGDPVLAGIQPLGGVEFTVATTVLRYVFNASTSTFDVAADSAADASLVTTAPETLLPGKEFKRILVAVAWEYPDGRPGLLEVEDALNGAVPRDSIALYVNRRGDGARRAEAIIVNPGSVPGVIPIAIGNESSTAASNPAPELLGGKNNTYVAETRFDVYTYRPLDSTSALAQSRVETSVVGCRCDTEADAGFEPSLRPTYWNGTQYAVPTVATYAPIAGPKPPSGSEAAQSDQCRMCCRDHHDPAGNDDNGVPKSAITKFSPRRTSHSHFLVNDASGVRAGADSGVYSEACRLIRVNGIFRVATDLHDDHFMLLPARNAGLSAFAPSAQIADDYGAMVKNYIDARITNEGDSDHYNDSHNATTSAGPDPASFQAGARLLADGVTTRNYDLNLPADYFLRTSGDSAWLHARGLYIDYLAPEAIARIELAKTACPAQPATADCVLPYLPFTSVNLSELAEWKDEAIIPAGSPSGQVLSVMNNGFKTATGDFNFVENGASGSAGSKAIAFAAAISSKIVPGMAASGQGLANGARVTAVSNSGVTLDKPHSADVGAAVAFEGAPVRGLALPGAATSSGYSAYARAVASYNNAAIALKFPINPDEAVLSDQQRIQFNIGGAPPDPTAGIFTVSGFADSAGTPYPFGTPFPVLQWGGGLAGLFDINACNRLGTPLPYSCAPASGLGGPMRILVSGYNARTSKTESFTGSCAKPNGVVVAVTGTTTRPYCANYDIMAASTAALAASAPFTVSNAGTAAETTEIGFALLNNQDEVLLTIQANGETAGALVSCKATGGGALGTVVWSDPCL